MRLSVTTSPAHLIRVAAVARGAPSAGAGITGQSEQRVTAEADLVLAPAGEGFRVAPVARFTGEVGCAVTWSRVVKQEMRSRIAVRVIPTCAERPDRAATSPLARPDEPGRTRHAVCGCRCCVYPGVSRPRRSSSARTAATDTSRRGERPSAACRPGRARRPAGRLRWRAGHGAPCGARAGRRRPSAWPR